MKIRGVELLGNWSPLEKRWLVKMLEPLPQAWLEQNPNIKSIVRRDVLKNAPPEAPGHSKYEPAIAAIVVFDKGVYHDGKIDTEQFRRSVYHELAHTILRNDPSIISRWGRKTNGDGFVDEYAKTSPDEDFCDTFSEFFIHKEKTREVVPRKARFMQNLLDSAQREKVAMNFISGFGDELIKMARPSVASLARRMSRGASKRTPGKMSVGKGMALAGGAGLAGAEAGRRKGKKKGYAEGSKDVMGVAGKARMLGRREGVLAYHRALMKHRKGPRTK
jgi:hypothetical protein